jgi:plastocyanin
MASAMSVRPLSRSTPRGFRPRFRPPPALAIAAAFVVALAPRSAAETLAGTVELVEQGRVVPGAGGAVVSYEPEGGAPRPAPRTIEVDTRNKRFLPRVSVVARGSSVAFPNRDPIFHNVFSVSPANRFDLGRYREGQSRSARFDQPGLVRVYCNVHEQMIAYVMVVETPYHAVSAEDGHFQLEHLPRGKGTLTVWHERSATKRIPIEVPTDVPLRVLLDATQAREAPHLNKFGRPYGSEPDKPAYR